MTKQERRNYWRGQLEGWRQSGETQAAYCRRQEISLKSFQRWRRTEKSAIVATTSALTLVPVNVGAPATAPVIQLHSPGGWRIELAAAGPAWLGDLLRHLP